MDYKIPIIEKVYEAYSAIADNRVKFDGDKVFVDSSNHSKTYTITEQQDTYISNDNMSYYVQTIGYPILATMMLEGKLNYNKDLIPYFKNINWKQINVTYKNDYVEACKFILAEIEKTGADLNYIKTETEKTYSEVKILKLKYIKSKIFPPK